MLLGDGASGKKKKKSSKKPKTVSQSTDEEEFMATMNAFGQGLCLILFELQLYTYIICLYYCDYQETFMRILGDISHVCR